MATTTLNSAITVQVSVSDSQKKIIGYLQTNKHKVNIKQLNLKISTALDTQMASAAANGTFDQTYQSVIQSQLTAYSNDLKTAYAADKGAKGRALLTADFNAAQLLIQQLNTPAS